jgi:hypothetical protein
VQLSLNIGERNVDDGDVEQEHEDADADDRESTPFPVHMQESIEEGLCYVDSKGERRWRSRDCFRARTRG